MSRAAIVSFDFTNTLVKFRHAPAFVYTAAALEHGVKLREKDVNKSFKKAYGALWSDHPNFGRRTIGCREFWNRVVSATLCGAGLETHPELRARISSQLYDAFATDEYWQLDDSAVSVLEQLKANDPKLIIISNMDERLEAILKSLRIKQYFDVVLSSYEAGFAKPDRRIFDYALRKVHASGKFTARSRVHIGDDLDKDFDGARKAGWDALWLNGKDEAKQIPDDCVVKSLVEVPRRIHRHPGRLRADRPPVARSNVEK